MNYSVEQRDGGILKPDLFAVIDCSEAFLFFQSVVDIKIYRKYLDCEIQCHTQPCKKAENGEKLKHLLFS